MSNRVGIVVRLVEAGFCAGVAVQAATSGNRRIRQEAILCGGAAMRVPMICPPPAGWNKR